MGKQVVYCDGCGRILLEDDFAKARASIADNRCFCVACRPAPAAADGAPPVKPLTDRIATAAKRYSTSRIPRPPSGQMDRPPVEAPAPRSRMPLILGGALTGMGALVLLLAVASGGKGGKPAEGNSPPPALEVKEAAAPPPPPRESALEGADTAAFLRAAEYRKLHPADLAGQIRRFEEVVRAAGARPVGEEARRTLASLHRKVDEERGAVESEAAPFLAAEDFRRAIEIWDKARGRYDLEDWTRHAAGRAVAIRDTAAGRYAELRARAVEARRRGAADEVRKATERVAKWGLPEFKRDLEAAVAAATPEGRESPAGTPAPPKPDAAASRWKAAMQQAVVRDFAAAIQTLGEGPAPADGAADLESLRGAAALVEEAAQRLAKAPRGQKLAVGYFDPSGARVTGEGVVAASDAHRIELRQGADVWVVPVGEVTASTLAELAKPKSAGAAALLCALEGDAEGARRQMPNLPARYEALAKEASVAGAPREAEARRRFYDAETSFFDAGLHFDAVQRYKGLLSEFGDTRFVRRNRGAIEARAQGARDFVLGVSDLVARGSFRQGRHNKVESCWISDRDVPEADLKGNFVEIRFSAYADAEYRCWVYAGGCCLETFGFVVQGTELTGPDPKNPKETVRAEPGSDAWLPAKLPYLPLKKLHDMHTGPKEPDRWEWIALPLPKYAEAGTKTLRLLSRQKGFSVATAVVSARRTGPPRDAEIRDAERERSEVPGYGVWKSVGLPSGTILRDVWSGVSGEQIADLRKLADFPDKPTATDRPTAFETPVDWADNYGTLMRGYVYPPSTGEYVFWIAGDDNCELWLSTDDQPKNKVRIASVPSHSGLKQWNKFPEQQSAPVALKAGRRYYVEALQKEGGGNDHLAVGWKLPGGTEERPIPGTRLAPFGGRNK